MATFRAILKPIGGKQLSDRHPGLTVLKLTLADSACFSPSFGG